MTDAVGQSAAGTANPVDFAEDSPKPAAHPLPSTRSAYWTLFVLGIVVMFTVLDRQVLSLLIEPIKADYGISDTQAALLLGAAFSLTYAIAGLPIARFADVTNRRNLIAACIVFWSGATVACGIAQNYAQLFLARMGIGAGESGYGPATWSMVTDIFPREKVAFATGTLAIGAQAGTGLALIIGGSVLAFVSHFPPVEIPFIGQLRPWQWAFIIVGFPGMLWGIVVVTAIKEPRRRGRSVANQTKLKSVPIKDVARYMADDWRTYLAVIGGHAMKYLFALGTTQWMPTLFVREFDWSLTRIGLIQGILIMGVGPLGLILGGKLSEYLTRRGTPGANMQIVFYALLATVPLSIVFPLMGNPYVLLALYSLNVFISSLGVGPATAAAQLITPNQMRAQIGAVKQFSSNVIAFALGPLIVALFTDYLFNDPGDLKYSMSLAAVVLGPLALLIVWQGLKTYARSYERTAAEFDE